MVLLLISLGIGSMISSCKQQDLNLKAQVGDIKMAYRLQGEGYPLIMIMGFGGTMDLWDPNLIKILSNRYKVIVFDNRGMGGTTAGDRKFTIEQFADDTAGLMKALHIDRAHVLGWSMGAEIAMEFILRHPQKVKKLILYAADCSLREYPPAPDVTAKLSDPSGTPEERGKRLISLLFPPAWLSQHGDYLKKIFSRPMEDSSPENIQRQASAMGEWGGCCERLYQIQSETLIITGKDDIITPPQNSYTLVKKIPGARLAAFEDGGHGLMYQFPERIAETVTDFLN